MSVKPTMFQSDWLHDPLFKTWISKSDTKFSTRCKICEKTINLSNMGRQAVVSHMNSKKHKRKMASVAGIPTMDLFLTKESLQQPAVFMTTEAKCPVQTTTSMILPSNSASTSAPIIITSSEKLTTDQSKKLGLNSFLLKDDVTRAEIIWTIESVIGHASARLAGNMVKLFSVMFPDSTIASKMQLQQDKIGYLILYGIAPYFKNLLIKELLESEFFTVEFDESLNKVTQKQQMDLIIRYWPKDGTEIKTRYLTSIFLGRSTASDLISAFLEGMSSLDLSKIIEISMDGPHVNFKFLRDLKNHVQKDPNDPEILEMGSCGLHTMHCSFKAGIVETGWDLLKFLRALYNYFKDVPARRQVYAELSGSTLFPLKFCAVRWLTNSNVAQRALEMIPHLLKYNKEIESHPKLAPKNDTFKIISEFCKDSLLPVKLTFFKSLANDIEPFLTDFQTDQPFAPFLYNALSGIIRDEMARIVNIDVMKEATSVIDVDMKKENNLLKPAEVKLGIATKVALNKVRQLKQDKVLQFRQQCKKCLQKMIIKLQERSPLAYKLTKAVSCLDPNVAVNFKVAEIRMNNLLTLLVAKNRLEGSSAEKAAREFKIICALPEVQESLKSFSGKTQRVDQFWYNIFKDNQPSDNITTVLKIACTLSHGNAGIERGFSVNKECLVENMKEETLVAKRCVYDAVTALGGITNLVITKELIHSARNARSRYQEVVDKRKMDKQTQVSTLAKKRLAAQQIKEIEAKKAKLLQAAHDQINSMDQEIETLKNQ